MSRCPGCGVGPGDDSCQAIGCGAGYVFTPPEQQMRTHAEVECL